MHCQDLGALDGPLLLFGGPYSNLQATQALRIEADRLGIPPSRVICTGDVVAYCGDPVATVDEIRDWGCHVVLGNCEESLGRDGEDCGCGFAPGSACDLLSVKWFAHAQASLSAEQKSWMAALPHPLRCTLNGLRIAVVHGHPDDLSGWVFASTEADHKAMALDDLDADVVIAGHSGLPFTTPLPDGRLWHNPGVIGMPANDGTPRVWYSILEPTANGLTLDHRALPYDHAAAQAAMAAAGLPDGYRKALGDGLWPSLDVLSPTEAAMAGQALSFAPIDWARPQKAPHSLQVTCS